MLGLHSNNDSLAALSKSLGDSFLLAHNPIYRTVRLQAVADGFSYEISTDTDYLALPLSLLETWLEQKRIFYTDNVSTLVKIESRIPQSTLWDEVYDNLKRNFVFHESCHAVARTRSADMFGALSGDPRLIQVLIEESFANTCELLGIAHVEDASHEVFYEFNSYIFIYEIRPLIAELSMQLGFQNVFKMVWLTYLQSNFLYDRLDDKNFKRAAAFLRIPLNDSQTAKKLKSLLRVCFELNPRFKEVTTGFYLRYAGLVKAKRNINEIDFMKLLEADSRYSDYFDKICHLFKL